MTDYSLVDRQATAENQRRFTARLLDVALIALFLLPVLIYAYGGTFTRYIADDYCAAGAVNTYGFLGSIDYWYQAWSGRYTEWVFKGIAAYFGVGFSALLPAFSMALLFITCAWTLHIIARLLRLRRPVFAALLMASGLTNVTVITAPNVFQSFYWTGAVIPYILPLTLFIAYIGYFLRIISQYSERLPVSAFVLTIGTTFVLGGTSEAYLVFQLAIFLIAMLVAAIALPSHLKRPALTLLGSGLLGSILAIAVVLVAPGVGVRSARFPTRPTLPQSILMTLRVLASFFATGFVMHSPLTLISLYVFSALIGYQFHGSDSPFLSRVKIRLLLGATLVIGLGLIFASIFPSIYVMSVAPPLRHYLLTKFALLFIILAWGYLMGVGAKKHRAQRFHFDRLRPSLVFVGLLLAVVILIGPVLSSVQAYSLLPQLATYAAAWDAQDSAIRAAAAQGESNVVVNALPVDLGEMAALDVLGENPDTGFNRCAAQYYGIDSLVVRHDS